MALAVLYFHQHYLHLSKEARQIGSHGVQWYRGGLAIAFKGLELYLGLHTEWCSEGVQPRAKTI